MAVHHFAIAPYETRNFETELADRRTHPIYGRVVPSGISGVLNEAFNRPVFYALGDRRRRTVPD
jgi:hypothetical protein